jgi:pimeloyl-ACP methyl ester carboxylesterase
MSNLKNFAYCMALVVFLLLPAIPVNAQIIIAPPTPCFVDPTQPHCTDPVIIVPALTASFNLKTILKDQPSDSWRFIPFGYKVYRGLIERLEEAGYPESKIQIAHYDWRQSNAESAAEYLKPLIEQAKIDNDADQVDIVAHSMGGLVAREYIQSDYYEDDVDQLILLGTPNEGASDAYVAWEGGEFPERWGTGTKWYIKTVEEVLKSTRDQKDIKRPSSFRAFFPSLKDLLPITDFVTRDGNPVLNNELILQNDFLQNLQDNIGLIASRGVRTTTVAGNNLDTLGGVLLNTDRTVEDNELERWRDGHPNPDPIQTDTIMGDQTVLLSSAHFGYRNTTLDGVSHVKLPEEAQEEVLSALGKSVVGSHIAYDLPDSMLGTVVLSPVDPVITGPGGEVLSAGNNTFNDAEFLSDPDDPNGPKMLVIANPPVGDYIIELNGTGDGDYDVVITYADEDDTVSATEEGTTILGQQDIVQFSITEDTFVAEVEPPTLSLLELTAQLREITHHGKLHHHHTHRFHNLHADRLHAHAKKYIKDLDKHGADHKKTQRSYKRVQKSFDKFMKELSKRIEKGKLDEAIIAEITDITDQIALHLEK